MATLHQVHLLHHFPNSICSLCVSVSDFSSSHNVPTFSVLYLLRLSVISDLSCSYYLSLKAQKIVSTLYNKVSLN